MQASVTLNQATGATGIGGGIYTVGTFSFDHRTSILNNKATTSGATVGL